MSAATACGIRPAMFASQLCRGGGRLLLPSRLCKRALTTPPGRRNAPMYSSGPANATPAPVTIVGAGPVGLTLVRPLPQLSVIRSVCGSSIVLHAANALKLPPPPGV